MACRRRGEVAVANGGGVGVTLANGSWAETATANGSRVKVDGCHVELTVATTTVGGGDRVLAGGDRGVVLRVSPWTPHPVTPSSPSATGPPPLRHHLQLHPLLGHGGGGHQEDGPVGDGHQRGPTRPRLPPGGLLPVLLRHPRGGRQRPLRGVGHGRQRRPVVARLRTGTGDAGTEPPGPQRPLAPQLLARPRRRLLVRVGFHLQWG